MKSIIYHVYFTIYAYNNQFELWYLNKIAWKRSDGFVVFNRNTGSVKAKSESEKIFKKSVDKREQGDYNSIC